MFVFLASISLAACKDQPNLSGEWRCESRSHSAVITQNGDTYLVEMHFYLGGGIYNDFKVSGKYIDGEIKIDPIYGKMKYSIEDDKLFFSGGKFVRVNQQNKM